jgi:VWFA-related protein
MACDCARSISSTTLGGLKSPLLGFSLWAIALAMNAQPPQELAEVRARTGAYIPHPTLRVETDLVTVDAVVRDARGRTVAGLKRENFRILDEGKERGIEAFSVDAFATAAPGNAAAPAPAAAAADGGASPGSGTPRPHFLVLFFDDLNTQDGPYTGSLQRAQTAATQFMKDAFLPGMRIEILATSGSLALDFTADQAKLTEAIKALRPHPRIPERGMITCPRLSPYQAYEIAEEHDPGTMRAVMIESALNNCGVSRSLVVTMAQETWRRTRELSGNTLDAIGLVVDQLAKLPGERTLLLASPGFMAAQTDERRDRVVEHARRAGVVIDTLDAKGLYAEAMPGDRPGDPKPRTLPENMMMTEYIKIETTALSDRMMSLGAPLADLAERTGGTNFHNNNDLIGGLRQMTLPPAITYRLAFRPENVAADGKYHRLKVKLVSAGSHSVTARPGYFAPSGQQALEDLRAKLERAVIASEAVADFAMEVTVRKSVAPGGRNSVTVSAHLDIATLRFPMQGDRHTQQLRFVAALLNAEGNVVAAKESTMDLALTDATYARLSGSGLSGVLTLQAPAGSYTLREVVEDAVDGKMACLSRAVDLR